MSRAHWSDVVAAFTRHAEHYIRHGGGEAALIGRRAEGSVTLQYAGRVVLELLQNALDRADRQVEVRFEDGRLVVANDGAPFTVDPAFDYDQPKQGVARRDFNALCALHTSNKSADRQLGNKGIGFRSVFGVARRVQVWSKLAEGGWWGLELSSELNPAEWPGSELPKLDERIESLGPERRPSFHFPRPLRRADAPAEGLDAMETAVLLEVEDPQHRQQIQDEVDGLAAVRLHFITLQCPGIAVSVQRSPNPSATGWSLSTQTHPDLAALARAADHAVPQPRVSVAWPPVGSAPTGAFFNYLPTRVGTGLPLDVHADFQLKADRDTMALGASSDVGRYNLALLERAAELHVARLREACRDQALPREDLWLLAGRPDGAPEPWVLALRNQLFPGKSWDLWRQLAASFFREVRPEAAYRAFWAATRAWLHHLLGSGHWTPTWRKAAVDLCDTFAGAGIRLIPVPGPTGLDAVALPTRQQRGLRAERRLFVLRDPKHDAIAIPQALLSLGRAVTRFNLGPWEEPSGALRFVPDAVLGDLRQIPRDPANLETQPSLTEADQTDLLAFAKALLPADPPDHFAWRAFTDSEDRRFFGRAIATLFLPTTEGRWEPARQLTADRVDRARLLGPDGEPLLTDAFLARLGVAPAGAVPLVEEGDRGRVDPLDAPPPLQPAGADHLARPLAALLDGPPSISEVGHTLEGLPADNKDSAVRHGLGSTAWLPRALFREHLDPATQQPTFIPLPERLAPRDVLTAHRDPRRVFLAEPIDAGHDEVLEELGAIKSLGDERTARRAPALLDLLASRCPNPDALTGSLRTRLAALFEALVDVLSIDDGPEVPVLIEHNGALRWRSAGEEAWLARDEDRSALRLYFPDLPRVAASHRRGLAERLGVREVSLRQTVRSDGALEETQLARKLAAALREHLAAFCALAEVSRLVPAVDLERVRRAWLGGSPPVEQAKDAWVELALEGPDLTPRPWRQGRFEDVFYVPGQQPGEPGRLLFDTQRPEGPPLRHFGEALARQLVGNPLLGPVFAEALAAIETGSLADLLERRHASELARDLRPQLEPLLPQQRAQIETALERWCARPAEVMRRGRIGRDDLLGRVGFETASALRRALVDAVADDQLADYLPTLVIASENRDTWRAWHRRWAARLTAWVAHQLEGEPPRSTLADCIEPRLDCLLFDPEVEASQWVRRLGLTLREPLEVTLSVFAPDFAPVASPPASHAALGWSAAPGTLGSATGGPAGIVTPESLAEEQAARAAWGDAAEAALLAWVVETTAPLLDLPGGRDLLVSAFPPSSHTRALVAKALDERKPHEALHIAKLWSGAGFDLLGLEVEAGEPVLTRYECKGLPRDAARIRIHLSRRELAVARQVQQTGRGRWRLVGVETSGRSVDLTPLVADLLTADPAPLQPLSSLGFEPDGLRLVVTRPVTPPSARSDGDRVTASIA